MDHDQETISVSIGSAHDAHPLVFTDLSTTTDKFILT